jgi:hypothetical protein
MAWEKPLEQISLIAAADLSSKQYYAIKVDSDGKAALAGAGENAIGILQDTPALGNVGNVMTLGVSKAVYGGTVSAGANLEVAAGGKLVAYSSGAIVGVALEPGSANEIHSVLLVTRTSSGASFAPRFVLSIAVKLSKVADGDIVTDFIPGIAGTIKKVSFVVTDPATTAAKAATLNLEIGTTNLTGGVISLTSANCTPLGAVVDGTAITAGNTFTSSDSISVEASSVTAFQEGEGVLLVVIQ